jgi:inhibitor of KinA sporulation pathway (predicted exonuclease)
MKICVIDLETNTPQNEWQRSLTERVEWAPIIEIGAVMLDIRSGKIVSTFQTFIDPGEDIFPEITVLTTITDADIAGPNSLNIKDGLNKLYEWMEANQCRFMAAWGRDCDEIEEQTKKEGVQRPHKMRKLDVKGMFEVLKAGLANRRIKGGLAATLETFGLEFLGRAHRAEVDALNTARLLYRAKEIMMFTDKVTEHEFRDIQQ